MSWIDSLKQMLDSRIIFLSLHVLFKGLILKTSFPSNLFDIFLENFKEIIEKSSRNILSYIVGSKIMNSETYVTGLASLLSTFFSHFLHGLFYSFFSQVVSCGSFQLKKKETGLIKKHLHQGTSELKYSVFFKNLHFKRSRQ